VQDSHVRYDFVLMKLPEDILISFQVWYDDTEDPYGLLKSRLVSSNTQTDQVAASQQAAGHAGFWESEAIGPHGQDDVAATGRKEARQAVPSSLPAPAAAGHEGAHGRPPV
jgi:hypothetical protein